MRDRIKINHIIDTNDPMREVPGVSIEVQKEIKAELPEGMSSFIQSILKGLDKMKTPLCVLCASSEAGGEICCYRKVFKQ